MTEKADPYLKKLLKDGEPDKIIIYLVNELKRMRAMVRSLQEDSHISKEQWAIRKAERNGKLPFIPLPEKFDEEKT